ncbi:RloB domain-containing protein [Flavobacterium sp.]|uniref:RloB domain-containing protein n=1 Tax=Flavobacterium sp. TaxID=239 RepID=UPI0037957D93
MSKPNKKNSRESKIGLNLKDPIISKSTKTKNKIPLDNDFNKRILIVCEGSTEYSYFEGLCSFYNIRQKNNFHIIVLPEKKEDNNQNYKGSSVKGLLYEAMKKKYQDEDYDEIWIVTDNDEENSFKLDQNSLFKIKPHITSEIYERLEELQIFRMNVRDIEEKKGENERIRYFLNKLDYEIFLFQNILLTDAEKIFLDSIIENTNKSNHFELLYDGDSKAFFYDEDENFLSKNARGEDVFEEKYFDKNWKKYKVAYTSIAFEHWLLLHFEMNNQEFYNSREIIKFFDDKGYFNLEFKKNQSNGFIKGFHLYALLKKGNSQIISFFKLANQAIFNNLLLNNEMQSKINENNRFYELNPFSDVFVLTNLLLNNNEIKQGFVNVETATISFENILVQFDQDKIQVYFKFSGKNPKMKTEIATLFSLVDLNNSKIQVELDINCETIIRKNDNVVIEIALNHQIYKPYFLFFHSYEAKKESIVWLIE